MGAKLGAACATVVLAAAAGALAKAQANAANRGASRYNPAAEITVKGTVEQVRQLAGFRGRVGTHVILKTAHHGTLDVHLGPTHFLVNRNLTVLRGDRIQVTGARAGGDVLLAREVTKNGKTVRLRNAQGAPLWPPAASNAAGEMRPGMMGGGMMGGGMMGQGRMMGGPAQPPAASGTNASPEAAGQRVFERRCAVCHNAASTAVKVGPGLKNLFQQRLVNGKNATEENVRALIDDGAPRMPAYGKLLTRQQVTDLIDYLKTL